MIVPCVKIDACRKTTNNLPSRNPQTRTLYPLFDPVASISLYILSKLSQESVIHPYWNKPVTVGRGREKLWKLGENI